MADNPENNPLMAIGHFFTSILHHDSYPAINASNVNLTGKSVFIIGASRGIGKATAVAFAQGGASFIALGARSDLSSVASEVSTAATSAGRAKPKVISVQLDITSEDSVKAAASQVAESFDGKLDILVHNSGIIDMGKITEIDPAMWWRVFEVNVYGPFLTVRYFMPLLLASEMKQIVTVSSVGAWLAMPSVSAYQMSKLAVLRFADFITAEYGEQGVMAFCVHPGNVLTDIVGGADADFPLKHLFEDKPDLCADTVVFLTSKKRIWLGGRYISCTWDMPELISREREIVEGKKLMITMQL